MRITHMKTNRVVNPLGYNLLTPRLSWVTEDTDALVQTAAQVQIAADEAFETVLFDSGKDASIDSLAFEVPLELKPRTCYYWRVTVWGDNGDTAESDVAWFETAKLDQPWEAKWITPDWEDNSIHPYVRKTFALDGEVASARVYVTGLGLYNMEINGKRVGEEYLSPNFNAYDQWIQYQTYDVTDLLKAGDNAMAVMLGNGEYKGRFGFDGHKDCVYGDRFALLSELHVTYANGDTVVICSDESWKATASPVVESSIYDGEVFDANKVIKGWSCADLDDSSWSGTREIDLGYDRVEARRSLPVVNKLELKPVELIHTPAGETVIDMGQNMVGWMRFKVNAPKGTEILLQHGEVLQDDNFFNANLRSAKAEYRFISDGTPTETEPYFTFYGFRFVKVTGWVGELNLDDFVGVVVYSDMEQTGQIETSNPLVNRLFLNALWGQRGNFVDVPTDCPQRDERMGWTGDAQVFAATASFNMDTAAFYNKYMHDVLHEQNGRGGNVPHVVPSMKMPGGGSSAWGDVAAVVPWTTYLFFGDKAFLEEQFDNMKGWVDYIKTQDEAAGGHRLWTTGFHFGDWLALDGPDPASPMGGTATDFISSAYYCYSAGLTAKAAAALGKEEEAAKYGKLADEVRTAIQEEYFSKRGRITIDTQTAMVVSLFMDLVADEHRDRVANALQVKLGRDKRHLKTGFVGTPYLCRTLSNNGANDLAYTLLLNEDYPSWLYAVKMGATTIWERWNSLRPDGHIGDLGMNSLNHYAYGSIMEWVYRDVLGLNPVEDKPGFRHVNLSPKPFSKLEWAKGSYDSAVGRYESEWKIDYEDGHLFFRFVIPFNATATLRLPNAELDAVKLNGKALADSGLTAKACCSDVVVELTAGTWVFEYQPTFDYIHLFGLDTPIADLLRHPESREVLMPYLPERFKRRAEDEGALSMMGAATIRDLAGREFMGFPKESVDDVEAALKKIKSVG
ncbi:MAG: family 78 glycoside hydrolase catalytic domain [Anaerolineaceae bacterium]|nr:family 78 glycoside hydrolase catalytic domain [Anaerolineaceae bacterium]